ncbi:hypothetical protein FFZ99_14210 [Leptospira interrogans]|nr:hypothetical protein FF006_13955 [Leptospira interrogans]TQE61776.1 hypothetical protein FFZ99_14210 [Leptospira interrogans]TQE63494.1 hypothetical protein FF001_17910 [Leptospira interrogans]TQE71317.1 hypothetical protein FF002_14010 [Leptospira interrogans]
MKVKINKTASIDFSIKQKQMEDSFFHNSIVNKLYIDTANFYHKICLRVKVILAVKFASLTTMA